MRIGEAAKLAGMTDSQIRFYEKKGLLTPARKAESGYRDYSEEDVRRLKLILLYRKMDFSLEMIEALFCGRISGEEALQQQARILDERMDMLQGALDLCRVLQRDEAALHVPISDGGNGKFGREEAVNMKSIDVDYYLNYVHEEEEKGRRFGDVEELLGDMAEFSLQSFNKNLLIYPMMMLYPGFTRIVGVLYPVLLLTGLGLCLTESYVKKEPPAGIALIWSCLIFIYFGEFVRYRLLKRKAMRSEN